jgi:hypothetical protein
MQNKFDLDKLPLEIQEKTMQNVSTLDLLNSSMSSKKHWTLFHSQVEVRKLLHHVVCGDYDAVYAMLQKDISLIFKKGLVTDCSGRTFESLSGFEYALWALDKHMWAMMLDCIPQNEEGNQLLEKLLFQYNKVNEHGITYKLNGITTTEKHFDFKNTILKELQTQVNILNAPGETDANSG